MIPMKFITIQSKEAIQKLIDTDEYSIGALRTNSKKTNLVEPYRFMMETLGFKKRPIFGCLVGHRYNFYGAKTDKNSYIAEFDIPDGLVNVHAYYSWTDFIYFKEFPNEFKDVYTGVNSVDELGKLTLLSSFGLGDNSEVQAVVERLRKLWLVKVLPLRNQYIQMLEKHELSDKLLPLACYENAYLNQIKRH